MKEVSGASPATIGPLVAAHCLLAGFAALVLPRLLDVWFPNYRNRLDDYPITFIAFAQMTLLCFYFAFGRKQPLIVRGMILIGCSYALGLLNWKANGNWFVSGQAPLAQWSIPYVWSHYRLGLIPIPSAGLAAVILSIRYRLTLHESYRKLGLQFRSLHLVLVTLLVACALMVRPWWPIIERDFVPYFSPFWQRVGAVNYIKADLAYWSILCGGISYTCFRVGLTRADAVGEMILLMIACIAVSISAAVLFGATSIDFWLYYVSGSLVVTIVVAANCAWLKRRGFRLVSRK